jgi:DNA-binding CsgD family transcriptional regulator
MIPAERDRVRLPLSPQELQVVRIYADGFKALDVAHSLGLTPSTVKGIIGRARAKYSNDGRSARNKIILRARLVEDGLVDD